MENVFYCTEIVIKVSPTQENNFLDYALIKLDRSTKRAGLVYARIDQLSANNEVAVIGHPSGLPMKIASKAFVLSNNIENTYFVTNLDTFGSNSGSPVINLNSYQVEGSLVQGTTDYVISDEGSCIQVNRCPESGDDNCAGENATKMVMVAEAISPDPVSAWEDLNCLKNLVLILILTISGRFLTIP